MTTADIAITSEPAATVCGDDVTAAHLLEQVEADRKEALTTLGANMFSHLPWSGGWDCRYLRVEIGCSPAPAQESQRNSMNSG